MKHACTCGTTTPTLGNETPVTVTGWSNYGNTGTIDSVWSSGTIDNS